MEIKVPFLDLKRAYARYGSEIEEAVIRVLRSCQYLNGRETEALERELSGYLGVKYAVGVSSGTEALYLILKALDLPSQSIVFVPSFTFIATSEVVLRAGLRPVFVDVDLETGNLALTSLQELYELYSKRGEKISAVIAVSIFGIPANLPELVNFCEVNNLYLIEDICQAFGAEISGKKVGSFGIASATSFYPTKNLSACGDAGMVFTQNEEIYQRVKILKEHGQSAPYIYTRHGVNGRIDEIQCAILRVKFKYFQEELKLRQRLAEFYERRLRGLPIKLLKVQAHGEPALSLFSIRVPDRARFIEYLKKRGIQTRIYYPIPLHLQPLYQSFGYKKGDLKNAERLCEEIVSLPFYPYLTFEEALYVVEQIRGFYGS